MAITNTWLKQNHRKASEKGFLKADRDGLYIRGTEKGVLTFVMRYRYNNKSEQVRIGQYPAITLEKAREVTLAYRTLLEEGDCPKIASKLAKIEKVTTPSFGLLFDKWFKAECLTSVKSSNSIYQKFEKDVLPVYGDLPADKLTVGVWMELFESVKERSPSVASILLTNTRSMYAYAAKRELVNNNPLRDISAAKDLRIKENRCTDHLDNQQLKLVLDAIEHPKFNKRNALFVKLCLLYGCRPNELRLARKSDFDFKNNLWTIPAENHKTGSKTGEPLIRPLVERAKELVEELMSFSDSEYLLVNDKTGEPLKDNFWSTIPKRINYYVEKQSGVVLGNWKLYDLRKTMRTNMSTLTQPWIAEIMLGHSLGKVFKVYDRYDYIPEMSTAYTQWCDKLEEIRQ